MPETAVKEVAANDSETKSLGRRQVKTEPGDTTGRRKRLAAPTDNSGRRQERKVEVAAKEPETSTEEALATGTGKLDEQKTRLTGEAVKTRLQSSATSSSMFGEASAVMTAEGLRGLWRGVLPSLYR